MDGKPRRMIFEKLMAVNGVLANKKMHLKQLKTNPEAVPPKNSVSSCVLRIYEKNV